MCTHGIRWHTVDCAPLHAYSLAPCLPRPPLQPDSYCTCDCNSAHPGAGPLLWGPTSRVYEHEGPREQSQRALAQRAGSRRGPGSSSPPVPRLRPFPGPSTQRRRSDHKLLTLLQSPLPSRLYPSKPRNVAHELLPMNRGNSVCLAHTVAQGCACASTPDRAWPEWAVGNDHSERKHKRQWCSG